MPAPALASRPRRFVPERMDDPALARPLLERALHDLDRVAAVSGTVRQVFRPLATLARRLDRRVRLLDLGTGGGMLAIGLVRRLRAAGIDADAVGIDPSARSLELARRSAARAGVAEAVRFEDADAVHDAWPGDRDAVVSSLFLHHLDDGDLDALLRRLAACGAALVVMNDLRRSLAGWSLAWAGTRLLSRCSVVHDDGPQSVCAALTPGELTDRAHRAGLAGATARRVLPQRMQLEWWRG